MPVIKCSVEYSQHPLPIAHCLIRMDIAEKQQLWVIRAQTWISWSWTTFYQAVSLARRSRSKQYWGFQSIFVRKTITNIIGILIYDHMVTLPEEITFIWCHPKMLSAMFFLANRYVALIGNIYGLFIDFLPATSYEVRWFRFVYLSRWQAHNIFLQRFQLCLLNVYLCLTKGLAVRDTC